MAGIPTPAFGYVWEQSDVNTNSVSGCELPYIIHSPAQPGRFLFGNRGITDDAGETARPIDLPSGYYQFDKVNPDGLFRTGYYSPSIDSSLISLEYTADLGTTWTTLLVWEGELNYRCRDNICQSPVDPDLIYMVDMPIDMGPIIWQAPFLRSMDHGLTWDTLYFETYYIPLRTSIYDIIPSPIDTNTAIFVLREDYFEDQTVLRVTHDAGESWHTSSVDSFQYWFGYIGGNHSDFVLHPESPESLFGFIKTGPYNIWAVVSDDTVLGEYDSVYLDYPHLQSIQTAWFDDRFGLYLKCYGGELQDTLYRFIWPDIHDYKPIDDIPTFHNVDDFSFHPNYPDTIIASHCWDTDWPGVIRSTDGGENWSTCETGQNGCLTSVFASKHFPNVVYATSYEVALYKSTDYGATWDTVFGDWPENPRYIGRKNRINTFFESPLDERTLILPLDSDTDDSIQIISSSDAGAHWEDGDIGFVDSLHFRGANYICSAPDNDSLWFAGYGVGLYCPSGLARSYDAGENWEMIIDTASYGHFLNSILALTSSYKDIGYM
ncbi:MAG: WD40/YVTN/BNR-like repeat-containing protein, partial [bacterium]